MVVAAPPPIEDDGSLTVTPGKIRGSPRDPRASHHRLHDATSTWDGAAMLRVIAGDCIRTVRSVIEDQQDAVDLVVGVWSAMASHAAHSLRVGKSTSLVPLGVLYQSRGPGGVEEPRLQVSYGFMAQYGVSGVLPEEGAAPGPSTKPTYADIAAAARIDKSLVPNVLAAMLTRFGEICMQYPHKVVAIDFGALGEIRCDNQLVEFVSARRRQPVAPATTQPQRTVRAMLARRQLGLGPPAPAAGAADGGPCRPAACASPGDAPADAASAGPEAGGAAGQEDTLPSARSTLGQRSMVRELTLRRSELRAEGSLLSARTQFSEGGAAADGAGFAKSSPPQSLQFPPLLDECSRTLAAPYGEELFQGSNSSRIASYFSPAAAALGWSNEAKCLRWRATPPKKEKKGLQPEVPPFEVLEREFENQKVLPGSPIDAELQDAGIDLRTFYSCLSRYDYYTSSGISDSVVAPISQTWVNNVGLLVEIEKFGDLAKEVTDDILRQVLAEMVEGYVAAGKKAIADYVLRDAGARHRTLVPAVPMPVPDWGSVPFVGIEGTLGGPPDEWRTGIFQNREALGRSLETYSQASLQLLQLWHHSEAQERLEYSEMLLVDLPPPSSPLVDIDKFLDQQQERIQTVVQVLNNRWMEDVISTLKKENLEHVDTQRFFRSASTLLSTMTRSVVAQSVEAFVAFFQRFANPNPLTPVEVTQLGDTDERESAFLTVKLVAGARHGERADEVKLKDSPEDVKKKILQVFQEFVVCLNDVKNPESSVLSAQRALAGGKEKALWGTTLTEHYVHQAEKFVESTVVANLTNIASSLHLYEPFAHLLTEDSRISEFVSDPSKTIDHYMEKYESLCATEDSIRQQLPNEIRGQMVTVECSELNEILRQKIDKCKAELLESAAKMNRDRNRELVQSFDKIMQQVKNPPAQADHLVDLEQMIENFRSHDLKKLLDEFSDIREWQKMLFECQHHLEEADFEAMTHSAEWVHTIDSKISQRETDLRSQRRGIEDKFTKEREAFDKTLSQHLEMVNRFQKCGDIKQDQFYLDGIMGINAKLEEAKGEAEKLREKEALLGWDPSEFEKLQECIDKLQPYEDLWRLVEACGQAVDKKWMRGPLFQIEPEAVDQTANTMAKKAAKLQALFDNMQPPLPTPAGVAKKIKKDLDAFKQHLPLIHALCNPGLRQRHWDSISETVGFVMERDPSFTLSRVIDMEVGKHIAELQDISDSASREYSLETTLTTMTEQWAPVMFELKPWKDTETYIVNSTTVDEMQSLMDDHVIKAQTMKGSPYATAFMTNIVDMENWLLNTQEIMDVWLKVQAVWLYLEPIFGSEDIVKQMPTEANLFKEVDATWRSTMAMAKMEEKAMAVTKVEGLLEKLKDCHTHLETVQKGLNDYLETKRLRFPRFFFLSNDNLLEILSETKDPTRVNPHMKKAFEGIQSLEFTADNRIVAMNSSEKERVQLTTAVDPAKARGSVELWLVEVEASMLETVRAVTMQSHDAYPSTRFVEWLKAWPGQVVIAIFCLYWTREVSSALRTEGNAGVRRYGERLEQMLAEIVDLVRKEIPPLVRCTLEALIVIFVHNQNVVQELARACTDRDDDFDWLMQLRYYIEENPDKPEQQDMFVRITNSFLAYAYEYIGNSSRLIVTPLTDRCYRTCCGALHLLYGAAPEGPAGTGKTETVKDLSKALARFCVVFNCSDELDYLAMAKFFKGLAASGGWACFDEFNRIDAEVLSVIAQQILTIQAAIRERRTTFEFEGTTLPILWTCNCFITMNPGYAGRAELPDNLKALFRTVAMMVPDYAQIAEIKLYAYGYEDARSLAQKIVTTYTLCSEQLSSQQHYDYGMRAVFAVLVRAGSLKRKEPAENESILMLQSINDVNLAKFLDFDVPLYTGICRDLFPGVELPKPDYGLLIGKLTEHLDKAYCQAHPYFVEKIIQFYECHMVRHSVMLVGLPFSGKTTALNTLQKALTDLANEGTMHASQIVHQARLNPKSIPAKDLYGCFDDVSREWTDGVVAVLFRDMARNQTEERKWLVFDGPVDAVWIENMNTVMDENKKLCLNSGEIIAMSPNMRTIIEPMDVEVASPATISRNGMVYFEPHLMGYKHLVEKTLRGRLPEQMDEADRSALKSMVDFLVPPLVKFVSEQCKQVSPTVEQGLVQSFLHMLTTHLAIGFQDERFQQEIADKKAITAMMDCYTIFSAVWGIGAVCETGSRQQFGQYFRKLLAGQVESHKPFKKITPAFPDRGSVFDYSVDLTQPGWVQWMETAEPQNIPSKAEAESIVVQTVDSVRYRYILDHCVRSQIKLLFCGPTGTGKTVYMQQALFQLPTEKYMQILVGFSAQTKCAQTQALVDAKLERRRKGVYGPPMGKQCVVMVDDLNMPVKERFGAQPPIEILRQAMDTIAYPPSGGWYDTKDSKHPFRSITDVVFFFAMGLPGGGRTFITPRILGQLYLVGFPLLDEENMSAIFNTILDWKMRADGFGSDITGLSQKLVKATLDIYKSTSTELLPTPMKVHYTFNLRDFAKVIFGVLLLKKPESEGPDRHIRLWVHEILRVFGDRLVDDTDRAWMLGQLRDTTKKVFQVSFDETMKHLDSNEDGKVDTLDEIRTLFFGDVMAPVGLPNRAYAECQSVGALQKEVEGHLASYNDTSSKPMDLVCFLYMLEHLSRVARVIKSPGGNALLVGVGGSGRQSCTRLAAFMADFAVFQVEICKGYGMDGFHEDLKKMLSTAGGSNERTVFLFSDSQIKDEGFVEDINNLLNSGEIPNLFPQDERVAVCETVRNAARDEGKAPDGTLTQLFAFFIERCRANVGVVLCFSPIGDGWRTRLRQFPSLVNCTTIDWYTFWPSDALVAVAQKSLSDIADLQPDVKAACVDMFKTFHWGSRELAERFKRELKRFYYTTPTSFLELIQTFRQLLGDKRSTVSSLKSKYEVGLEKLTNTETSVGGMKQELIALQPQLVQKNKEVGEMMVVVNEESAKTAKVKEVVAADEAVANEAAQQAEAIKRECTEALDEAMPALNDALKALDTLSSKEIAEVKAMKNPAAPVRLVLSAVCILKSIKPARVKDESGKMVDDYWPAATKMISEMGFLDSLQKFDRDNIPPDIVKKISTYTPQPDFQPDRVKQVSTAAHGLCLWVRAMETYDRVAKVVAPKRESLREAEAAYASVADKLKQKRADLQKVVDQLDELNNKLANLRKEQEDLTAQVRLCETKLERAETLIASLGGEKTRWTQNAKDLTLEYNNLTGDVLVASGVIAYLGAFTPEFREAAVTDWTKASMDKEVPGSEKMSLAGCLGEPVKIRAWIIAGLPNDSFSVENGIIVDKSRRWPLCIDPQGQANRWIKKMGQPQHIVVSKFTDGDYLKRLEGCIQFGHPMLIENILEETDPAIEPVLLRQTFKKGNTLMLKLGEAIIEYQKDFKFYMTTKLRNPHYLPEVAVKVTLLNFMITQVGLQDQLLNIVVEKERPDLAEEKARLVVEGAENKEQLEKTENKILDVLSSSQGNILDDESAVQVLSSSKQLSNEIAEKQKIAEETEQKIDEARLQYVPVAFQASVLFFCIADLANIDPMYQYSLPFFINLFKTAIFKSEASTDINKRIDILNDFFMEMLYKNICRSLFEKHKLLFSFLLTMRLQITNAEVSVADYRFLLTGGVSLDEAPPKPAEWVPDRCWSEIFKMGKADERYQVFHETFRSSIKAWREIYDSADPLSILQDPEKQPTAMNGMNRFNELMVLRCVRPDRMLPAILAYVANQMGSKFVTPPPFDIAGSYQDSSNVAPLIFILSPGSDPSSALNMFAAEKGKEITGLSLGQGQGPKAERLLEEGSQMGFWVLLQNCHLFSSWMPRLEKILENMDPKHVSSDFRLWLTSYPSDKFPVPVLQSGVKITNEAPQGLRANLIGSFLLDPISNEEFFEKCTSPTPFKKLLYALCFFHAVIQERRLFGPLGWNIPYEFTQNDLRISARQLRMFIDESVDEVPFKAINYLTGECNYGGRVTEKQDRRLLMTLLADYYSPSALNDDYTLCVEHPEYVIPPAGTHEATLEAIGKISMVVPPGVYGFHENANLTREQNETYSLMDNLLLTAGQAAGGGGSSSEDTIREVAEDILRRTPEPWNLAEVQEKYPTMYEESMNTVLIQELTRFNRLIHVIKASLHDIQKALKGLLLMSEDLEQVFNSIFNGKTPALWLASSYPSLKPLGSYTNDLTERLKFFQNWVDRGIPVMFWISGIYFTQAFTTGASQNYARKYTIPIDTLTFDFETPTEQEPKERPENGVYTYGTFLEGCKWDWQKWELEESDPKVLYVPVPLIWIVPCKKVDLRQFPSYECPMYKVSTRKGTLSTTGHSTNFVMPIRINSSHPESHWVKRGVAMLTQLDS